MSAPADIGLDTLRDWMRDAMIAAGAGRVPAETTAACLADAHRRGLDTHGAPILRLYLPRLRSGAMDGRARPSILRESGSVTLLDGNNALGPYVAAVATDIACASALATGVGVVGVRRSNHFGAASVHSDRAARAGCVGLALSNSDPGMAPAGALEPVLGTNPIAIAAPGLDDDPVSLDMATSQAALGKVRVAAREGAEIPLGWAIGPDGEPTTDPGRALAGSMLPLGGHKGFALGAMVDVLGACLTGAEVSPNVSGDPDGERPQGTGHLFVAIAVDALGGEDRYRARLEELTERVTGAPRSAATRPFMLPGDPERATARERAGRVPLEPSARAALAELGRRFATPFPTADDR